jgi:hypothetical protein
MVTTICRRTTTDGILPLKSGKDIWMRDKGDHYEYVAVYVDDLLIASREPQSIITALETTHKFKLKGSGPTEFHLGCDFVRDEHGRLGYAPSSTSKDGSKLRTYLWTETQECFQSAREGDHPELDCSELLNHEDTKIYQSLIGALQWVVQLGRIDHYSSDDNVKIPCSTSTRTYGSCETHSRIHQQDEACDCPDMY